MSYKIETDGFTITVELEHPSWTPHVLIQDRFGDVIQLRGNQLNAIRAIRRALTDIIDATKRRAEEKAGMPQDICSWCDKDVPAGTPWSPFCSQSCCEADARDARATAADAQAMREGM